MKRLFTLIAVAFTVISFAQPKVLGTNLVDGNNQGFNYQLYNTTLCGNNYFAQMYTTRLQATSSGAAGTRKWEFFQGTAASPDYANNWRPYQDRTDLNILYNTVVAPNTSPSPITASTATYNGSSGGSGGWLGAVTAGNWYTVNINTASAGQNNWMSILETSYQPTNFAAVNPVTFAGAGGSSTIYPGQEVTITVTMAAQPQPGERVYVQTSYVDAPIEVTNMVGGVGTIVVPRNVNAAGGTIAFYAFTAPVAVSNVDLRILLALNVQSNGAQNTVAPAYTYTVANGWTTAQDGDWSTPATWVGNDVPPTVSGYSLGSFSINHNVANNLPNFSGTYFCYLFTVAAGKTLSWNGGAGISAAFGFNGAGTLIVAGTGAIGIGGTGMQINTIQHNSTAEIQVSGGVWNVPNYSTTSNSPVRLSGTTAMQTGGTFYSLGISGTLNADIVVLSSLFTYGGTITAAGNRTITIGQAGTTAQLIANLGGGFQGVDAGVGNNINLIVTGQEVVFSTANGSPSIDLRKFFTITVQAGSKLTLEAGIMAKYGSFNVNPNGKIQINNGGFIESTIADSKPASYNQAELIYNHTLAEYTQTIGEWPAANAPSTVVISSAGVKMTGSRMVDGLYLDGPLNLNANTLTIDDNGSIFRRAAAGTLSARPIYGTSSAGTVNVRIMPPSASTFNSGNEVLGTLGSINLLFTNNTTYSLQNDITANQLTVNSGVFIAGMRKITLKTGGNFNLISNAEIRTSNPEGLAGNALATLPNTNNPTININGIVTYNSAVSQKVSPLNYVNLNLLGGRKYLAGNANVSGNVNFNNQCLLLTNDFVLGLTASAFFQNTNPNSAFVATALEPSLQPATAGGVRKTLGSTNLGQLIPIGNYNSSNVLQYTPVRFSNSGTTDDFTFRCRPGIITGVGLYTPSCINNTWDISEANPGGSTTAIELQWPQALEGGTFTRTSCAVVHSNGSFIDQLGNTGSATNMGSGNYSITGSGFTSFSPFGVTSSPTILPLANLLQFNAGYLGEKANIDWTVTMGFKANYTIEHSTDGRNFLPIGTINSGIENQYSFIHNQPVIGKNFYRLLVKEPNGQSFYSSIKTLVFGKNGFTVESVFPNPFAQQFMVKIYAAKPQTVPAYLTDITGKKLWQTMLTLKAGSNQQNINLPVLPAGNYMLLVVPQNGERVQIPVVKQ